MKHVYCVFLYGKEKGREDSILQDIFQTYADARNCARRVENSWKRTNSMFTMKTYVERIEVK